MKHYKHLQIPLYRFIRQRLSWLAIVAELLPEQNDEETQQAIHYAEVAEFTTAIREGNSWLDTAIEAADVVWTSVYFREIEVITPSIAMPNIDFDEQLLEYIDPLVLQAVSDSNFSKLCCNVLSTSINTEAWVSHLDKKRFRDVRVLHDEYSAILVGTDFQNPDKPQRNKVLKPKGYKSAKEIYETLKRNENG